MNTSELSIVPLHQATLCLDCDMITVGGSHCRACGSVALLNLARTLNRHSSAGSMPVRFVEMARVAQSRTLEQHHVVSTRARRSRHVLNQGTAMSQVSNEPGHQRHGARRPHSIRELACIMRRARDFFSSESLGLGRRYRSA